MTSETNRRRWTRLGVEGAVAIDDAGHELGHVIEVSGGGAGVRLNPDRRLDDWTEGRQLRITVQEAGAAHTLSCRVCYIHDGILGLEFTT